MKINTKGGNNQNPVIAKIAEAYNEGGYLQTNKKSHLIQDGNPVPSGLWSQCPEGLWKDSFSGNIEQFKQKVKRFLPTSVYGDLFLNNHPSVVGLVMRLDRREINDRSAWYLNEDKKGPQKAASDGGDSVPRLDAAGEISSNNSLPSDPYGVNLNPMKS